MYFCGKKKSHALWCVVFFLILLIFFDQMIKWLVVHTNVITHICNYGVAMGIVLPQIIFIVLWGAIMACVIYFLLKKINERFIIVLPYVLILAGGLSNLIDRILHGCVIDYIPLLSISSFNFADALITCGAVLILWYNFYKPQKRGE